MNDRFGPWTTALGPSGACPQLSHLWKARMARLAEARDGGPPMTRRDLMKLGLAGAAVAALPTLRLTAAERGRESTRTPITVYAGWFPNEDFRGPLPGVFRIDPQTGSRTKVFDVNQAVIARLGGDEARARGEASRNDPRGGMIDTFSVRVSPDGTKLAYNTLMDPFGAKQGEGHVMIPGWIWIYDLRDGSHRQVVPGQRPIWSGDGRRLYFRWTDPQAGPDEQERPITRVVDLDGSNMADVPIPRTDVVEDCSLDGDWLVTSSVRHVPNRAQTYIMHPDGTGDRQLTDYLWNRFPRISPDGRSVAYTVFEGNDRHLDVVDIDGRNRRRVLKGDEETVIAGVSWSPDGERFAVGLQRTDVTRGRGSAPIPRPWPVPDRSRARIAVIPSDGGEGGRVLPVSQATIFAAMEWR